MRIGTISLNINTHDFNYGAMLHSWAFQQYLLKQDYVESTEIIDYVTPRFENYRPNIQICRPLVHFKFHKAYRGVIRRVRYQKRKQIFRRFIAKHMKISEKGYNYQSLKNAELPYDVVICESDVIWSPKFFLNSFDESFFLAHPSMKDMLRIAYSPSLGDGLSDPAQQAELSRLLENIDAISCRETYGVEILRKCTDRPVAHVQDPVMLLDAKDYDGITGRRITENPYILMYLPVDDNNNLRRAAAEYAESCGYELLEISTKLNKPLSGNTRVLPTAGIEEFLSAIKHSSMVFTNSFHAVCFSMLFHKQFYVFSRKYAGKVKDICKVYGLSDRICKDDVFEPMPDIDYSRVQAEIDRRRAESEEWLRKALGV